MPSRVRSAGRTTRTRAMVAALTVVALVLVSCGGGDSSPPKAVGSGSSAPDAGTTVNAPDALVASHLLASVDLTAAVGTPVQGAQDDGGYTSQQNAFVSQVETTTSLTRLSISLISAADSTAADTQYQQLAGQSATALPGVGTKASYVPAQQATVLSGSQVLSVRAIPTVAGGERLAATAKSPQSLDAVLTTPMLATTKTLASKMSGQAAAKPYVQIPAGAVNPCSVSVKALSDQLHKQVTGGTVVQSQMPPAQQCTYMISSKPFSVLTYTAAQAAAALPPTTLATVFDTSRKQPSRVATLYDDVAPYQLYMKPDADWVGEFLLSDPRSASTGTSTPAAAGLPAAAGAQTVGFHQPADVAPRGPGLTWVRVQNGYTFVVDYEDCYDFFLDAIRAENADATAQLKATLGVHAANAIYQQLTQDIADWCRELANPSPAPPDTSEP
jgi:hypothetical protein